MTAQGAPPTVAAFDFDGTLTFRDTFTPYLARGLGWPAFGWALLKSSPWLAGFALRLVSNSTAKARLMRVALAGRSTAETAQWTERWLALDFPGQLREDAMEKLAWHRQSGHCCVMVSASPDLYLERVARQLGFDALICTQMETVQGSDGPLLTGRMATGNCHGEQKVVRLKAWLAARYEPDALASLTLYAYGDTWGDKPMLRMAQHATYRGQPWHGD